MKKDLPYRLRAQRLWLALRLPDLPAQALQLDIQSNALLIITEERAVIWASAAAIEAGVVLQMDATRAHLLTGAMPYERNREQEKKWLDSYCESLYALTPYIEIYVSDAIPQSGLLLEISSCLQLFGGAQTITQKAQAYFSMQPTAVALGLAHSAKAAWLLSFSYYPVQGDETQALFVDRLKHLPITCLQDYPKPVEALMKMGFVTLGDIAKQIEIQTISSMKKRFGKDFADYLCDIFGIDRDFQQTALFEKPVTYYTPPIFFTETVQFEYPIHQVDQLQEPIEHLLKKLTAFLRQQQYQTHRIEWVLSDIYHHKESLAIYADTAQTQGSLFFDLTLIQLENRDLPFEVDNLALHCRDTEPLEATTQILDFATHSKPQHNNFTLTAAKLKARLGDAAVYKLSYSDTYIPEMSQKKVALNQPSQQNLPDYHRAGLRPSWLFKEPIPIEARAQGLYWRGYLSLLAGPERLQGHWWDKPSARDYFLAQRKDAVRLWVFLDLHKKTWFVQGVFS